MDWPQIVPRLLECLTNTGVFAISIAFEHSLGREQKLTSPIGTKLTSRDVRDWSAYETWADVPNISVDFR